MSIRYDICAPSTGYTPAVAADWGPVDPTTIANALDQLAATTRAGVDTNPNAIGPSNPLTYTTPAITPVASGKFLVWAELSIESSVAVQANFVLRADAITPVASVTGSCFDGGGVVYTPITMFGLVSLLNTANHTFSVDIAAAPGPTFTVLSGGVRIMWLEIGG
jgi:hypothetical protein